MTSVPEFHVRYRLVRLALHKKERAIPPQKGWAHAVFPNAAGHSPEAMLSDCIHGKGGRRFPVEMLPILLRSIDPYNVLEGISLSLWLAPLDEFKAGLLAANLLTPSDCEVVPLSQRIGALADSTGLFELLKHVRRTGESMNEFEAALLRLSEKQQAAFEGQLHKFISERWQSATHRHPVSVAAQILARMTSRGLTHGAIDKAIACKIVASPLSVLATARALCHLAMRHGQSDLFIEDIAALISDPARRHEDHQEQLSFHGGLKEATWKINEHFIRPGHLRVLDVGRAISVYPLLLQKPDTRDLAMLIRDKMIIAVRELSIGAPLVREVEALMTAREAARYRR